MPGISFPLFVYGAAAAGVSQREMRDIKKSERRAISKKKLLLNRTNDAQKSLSPSSGIHQMTFRANKKSIVDSPTAPDISLPSEEQKSGGVGFFFP